MQIDGRYEISNMTFDGKGWQDGQENDRIKIIPSASDLTTMVQDTRHMFCIQTDMLRPPDHPSSLTTEINFNLFHLYRQSSF